MPKLTVWKEIITQWEGRVITGSYAYEDRMVIVRTSRGQKAARLRKGMNEIWLAGQLLSELASEGKV
jgi:hypothetical protein